MSYDDCAQCKFMTHEVNDYREGDYQYVLCYGCNEDQKQEAWNEPGLWEAYEQYQRLQKTFYGRWWCSLTSWLRNLHPLSTIGTKVRRLLRIEEHPGEAPNF